VKTLRDLVLEQYGSVAKAAEPWAMPRSPLSSALSGRVAHSKAWWADVGRGLGLTREELLERLHADEQRHAGGGSLAGSIKART
jgi:hypothetical protein